MLRQRDHKYMELKKANKKHDRKFYIKPQLVEYGHMEKLTKGGTGPGIDVNRRKQ